MEYEIVNLEEKTLVSLKPTRLSGSDPKISSKIEYVWHIIGERLPELEGKIKGSPICTYSNFENDERDFYDVAIGFEFPEKFDFPKDFETKVVPAGKYAKFVIKGNVIPQLGKFWANLHTLNLSRKYNCDFDVTLSSDMMNGEVHIFVGLK